MIAHSFATYSYRHPFCFRSSLLTSSNLTPIREANNPSNELAEQTSPILKRSQPKVRHYNYTYFIYLKIIESSIAQTFNKFF